MVVIHKQCNAEVKSSGKGDWGICSKCGERVDHLVLPNNIMQFSKEVEIKW